MGPPCHTKEGSGTCIEIIEILTSWDSVQDVCVDCEESQSRVTDAWYISVQLDTSVKSVNAMSTINQRVHASFVVTTLCVRV